LKEENRKRSTLEENEQYQLWLDVDGLNVKEVIEILKDVRTNIPKEHKGKKVRVYFRGSFSL